MLSMDHALPCRTWTPRRADLTRRGARFGDGRPMRSFCLQQAASLSHLSAGAIWQIGGATVPLRDMSLAMGTFVGGCCATLSTRGSRDLPISDRRRNQTLAPAASPAQSSIVFLVGQESLALLSGRKLFRIFWPTGAVRGLQTC